VEECQCRPAATPLTCGSRVVGSLAPSDDTTDLFIEYGRSCALGILSIPLSGPEMTYRFSFDGLEVRQVTARVETVCSVEQGLYAMALDGSFVPCDPTRCVGRQARDPAI